MRVFGSGIYSSLHASACVGVDIEAEQRFGIVSIFFFGIRGGNFHLFIYKWVDSACILSSSGQTSKKKKEFTSKQVKWAEQAKSHP